MKKQDAIKLAGSAIKLAKVLGITKGAVSHWGELRYIKPEWFQEEKKK
jgi:DNA-binding transcriptional regulator YdaS (Cro superfamily)